MVLISSLFALALPALAPAQPLATPLQDELFSFSVKPVEDMLSHPKDAGLRRALELLPARIEALALANGEEVPPGLIPMLADIITAGKTLRVVSAPNNPIPVQASLSLAEADSEKAAARNRMIMDMLRGSGAPLGERLESGLFPLDLPPVEGNMPVSVQIGNIGNDFLITLGTDQALPRTVAAPPLPAGINATWEINLDIGTIYKLIGTMPLEEEDAQIFSILGSSLGSMSIRAAGGTDADRSFTTAVQTNVAAMAREAGALAAEGINTRDLSMIPADAQMAILMKANIEGSLDMGIAPMASMLAEMGVDDPFEVIAQETGIDIRGGLLAHLGETMGFYLSNTTGGGTFASGVGFIEITNRQGVSNFMDQIREMMAAMIDSSPDQGPAIGQHDFTIDGVEYSSLTFPGLPIPVEPTYALLENWLVFGLSPQATRAAVWQIRSDGRGLQDNPRFVEQATALNADDHTMALRFFDTPALLADGYTWMNMAMGAAANGLRSADGTQDPGMLMDPFPILAQGAKAMLEITTYEGDDALTRTTGDASIMVNLTGLVGFLDRSGLMMALPLVFLSARQSSSTSAAFGPVIDYATPPDLVESDPVHSDHFIPLESDDDF